MQLERCSGILLHVTSLPSRFGIGDLGPGAEQFIEFLKRSKQRVWQVLPLVPVDDGGSPYSSSSTFAGNPLLISPELLIREGLLSEEALSQLSEEIRSVPDDRVDYAAVRRFKYGVADEALRRFRKGHSQELRDAFEAFRRRHSSWLEDYSLFAALKEANGRDLWQRWPEPLAQRDAAALAEAAESLAERIDLHRFAQFLFERQWQRVKRRANDSGIQILGDLPIYVAHDSADVWANPDLFELDAEGNPKVVAGVPPDYFSQTGQRWGNPIYRWNLMAERGYHWWMRRFQRSFELVDQLRIDHFRGFQAYWAIPASEPTAVNGQWIAGPGANLFRSVEKHLGSLPIIAEDLGLITPDVTALMDELGFPGMAVLHFAFGGGADSSYLPHNFRPNLVAYTGTHDNDTTAGWWRQRLAAPAGSHEAKERQYAERYMAHGADGEIHWSLIHMLMSSVARLVIFPIQDVLGLGSEARMNVPGQVEGNWQWRMRGANFPDDASVRLREMVEVYGRE